ncbi:hypothetical protein [Paludisphaera sp.]
MRRRPAILATAVPTLAAASRADAAIGPGDGATAGGRPPERHAISLER